MAKLSLLGFAAKCLVKLFSLHIIAQYMSYVDTQMYLNYILHHMHIQSLKEKENILSFSPSRIVTKFVAQSYIFISVEQN